MPFDPSVVSLLPLRQESGRLIVEWTTTAPDGTWFQVYVGRVLAKSTRRLKVSVPVPTSAARIDVGAVLASERGDDLSATLPAAHREVAVLRWLGGSYLDPAGSGDVAGFRIYGEPRADSAVDYSRAIGDLAAYTGETTDGWGMGGWGQGGWGFAAASYEWSSGPLGNGSWSYAVRTYDAAGNEGPPMTVSVAIEAPPPPPGLHPTRGRMWYEYDPATRIARLFWLASGA